MELENNIRIIDGGSGFEAIEMCKGKIEIANHKCWSSRLLYENQNLVRELYKRFINAGSEVITSLSYQANPFNISSCFNITIDEAESLVMDSVLLAKEEVRRMSGKRNPILVAASIGPYGAHLSDGSEYSGSYIDNTSLGDITDTYRNMIGVLMRTDPDILAFETIPTIEEVRIIIELMREFPNAKAWISMSSFDGLVTVHGDKLLEIVDLVNKTEKNMFAFGLNCSVNLHSVREAVRRIRDRLILDKTIVLYPNNGERFRNATKDWYYPDGNDKDTFYELIPSWIDEGARWIGGCCKMGSVEMTKVAKIVNDIRNRNA